MYVYLSGQPCFFSIPKMSLLLLIVVLQAAFDDAWKGQSIPIHSICASWIASRVVFQSVSQSVQDGRIPHQQVSDRIIRCRPKGRLNNGSATILDAEDCICSLSLPIFIEHTHLPSWVERYLDQMPVRRQQPSQQQPTRQRV